jgi:primosomal protein N'
MRGTGGGASASTSQNEFEEDVARELEKIYEDPDERHEYYLNDVADVFNGRPNYQFIHETAWDIFLEEQETRKKETLQKKLQKTKKNQQEADKKKEDKDFKVNKILDEIQQQHSEDSVVGMQRVYDLLNEAEQQGLVDETETEAERQKRLEGKGVMPFGRKHKVYHTICRM